jgi:hypothetical protein
MSHAEIDPVQALHADAKGFPGGITALASRIGRSPGVMHNKFSAADDRYEITDREADSLALIVQARTGACGYIEAKCAVHGGVFVALPDAGEAADDDVLGALLDSMRSLGEMARELTEARADGVITAEEFSVFAMRASRMVSSVQAVVMTVKDQVRELPASLRAVM